jgi:hypothetical protein
MESDERTSCLRPVVLDSSIALAMLQHEQAIGRDASLLAIAPPKP